MTHLDTWHTSYNQKKGRELNWQFDSRPLNVKNHLNFLVCRWSEIYHWKALDEGYNFASDLISIRSLHVKLWAPKVMGVLVVGIWDSRTKWHLGVGPMAMHKIYYKREGGGFLQVWPWWVLWVCVCLWLVCAPKCYNYALTNLLFGLCRSVWVSEVLVNLPSPISELQHAPPPPKCYELGSTPQLLLLPLSSPLDLQLSPSRSLGVRHYFKIIIIIIF